MSFDKFGLKKSLEVCPFVCRIKEGGTVLDGTDDITFDNNNMMINAKQDHDEGYNRNINVECTTDNYKTSTDGDLITIQQKSRCTEASAITKKNADDFTVVMSKGWSKDSKPDIDYGMLSDHTFCEMTCELRALNGDEFTAGEMTNIV